MLLKRLSLGKKLGIVAILGMVSLSVVAIFTFGGLKAIGNEIEEIAEYQIPLNSAITKLEKNILQQEIVTCELAIASQNPTSSDYTKLEKHINSLEASTDEIIKKSEQLAQNAISHATEPKIKKTYEGFMKELKVLEKEQHAFKDKLMNFEQDLALGNYSNIDKNYNDVRSELKSMDKHITSLMKDMTHLIEASTLQAEHDEQLLIKKIAICFVIAFFLMIVCSKVILTNILTAINNFQKGLESFFAFLNHESHNVDLLNNDSKDEIGDMTRMVNENIDKIHHALEAEEMIIDEVGDVVKAVSTGSLSGRVHKECSNPVINKLVLELNAMMDELQYIINHTLETLHQYENKDFRVKTSLECTGEICELMKGIDALGDAISQMLLDNLNNGKALLDNSNTLTKNIESVSNGASQQAAALEETAAAIEEIAAVITQNTDHIKEMNAQTKQLENDIVKGQESAQRTVSAMDKINNQTQSIVDAITVIDQIAFQTNILSLNAAVEAATAGEAGKGFAVVAQEVRNLATRSAEAAKEIKALVDDANEQTTLGKQEADEMIEGYASLNDHIHKTTALIENIAMGANEQKEGIEQINDAITELDRTTQINAESASQTKVIAVGTNGMADKMLQEVNSTEFIGKDGSESINNKTYCDKEKNKKEA